MVKKVFYILSTLGVLLGGVLLCVFRWNAWFSNPDEPQYVVPEAPSNIIVTLDTIPDYRTFSWRTSQYLPSFLVIDGDTVAAASQTVSTRGGEATYYSAKSPFLLEGKHTFFVQSGNYKSVEYTFEVQQDTAINFLLFGDIQEKDSVSLFAQTVSSILTDSARQGVLPHFMAYVGDVIERPTDEYWQLWYNALDTLAAIVPQEAAVGNHEYLKGVRKQMDERWPYVFVNPQNGPSRFKGSTYYVDYPYMRLIVLNTEALVFLSDYFITQTWLEKVLEEDEHLWKVVVMHHPVYSSAVGRSNLLVHSILNYSLRKADVIFAGHDHNYARRCTEGDEGFVAPVYVVTSSSSKYYLPKCNNNDHRLGTNRGFYEDVHVTANMLSVSTYVMETGELYDSFTIDYHSKRVDVKDSLTPEILEMPDRYKDSNELKVRRSMNRMTTRMDSAIK